VLMDVRVRYRVHISARTAVGLGMVLLLCSWARAPLGSCPRRVLKTARRLSLFPS